MARNIVGTPARGEDFFDREETIELIWNRLETSNILLAAPRRFGKTSVMYRLIDAPRMGWKPIHVDAESIREPVNFVIALLDAMMADKQLRKFLLNAWKNIGTWLRGLFESAEVVTPWDVNLKIKLKNNLGAQWPDKGEALLHALSAFDPRQKLLIIIDELPVMLQLFQENQIDTNEIRAFLYWFRKLRTDPGIGLNNCCFLVGGSIGIENCLSQIDASPAFNDFERITIDALSPKKALEFLQALLADRKINLSSKTQKKLLELVGAPIPYFIQVFVAEIANSLVKQSGAVGPQRLGTIYNYQILGSACKTYFEHYYQRLQRYSKADELAAKILLKELALAYPQSLSKPHLYALYKKATGELADKAGFNRLIAELENDFYVICQPDDTCRFLSKILCDWWRRYYAF